MADKPLGRLQGFPQFADGKCLQLHIPQSLPDYANGVVNPRSTDDRRANRGP